ncbi:uncharacterized protein LOC115963066 isoform X1 [Quercus lobata]|uniref:uncharacterized protein LOC115963066 isoform X1 n=1 Tax=Quercus lobata TaxID=97700 RepID=UPI0012472CFE|nr:uncharacterized protein LOC115963066 isoform X1 [Quercus lobata]
MAKPLFLPVTPILIPACLCRSHGLRFVYMYQQYMRRRHRKRHHYGFAGGIQALRAHVAEPLILPKNLKQKDFERFNQGNELVHAAYIFSWVCKCHSLHGDIYEQSTNTYKCINRENIILLIQGTL